MEYSGATSAALATGIIGTTLAGLLTLNGGNGNGFSIFGGNRDYVTKDELAMSQQISEKDSTIALLKSESNTESKIADVYEKISTRILADERQQADWNTTQAVYNASANSAIAVLQNQVGVLNGLTKTVIPNNNVCPGWGSVQVVPYSAGTTIA